MNRLSLVVVLAGCAGGPVQQQQQCPLEVLCGEGTTMVGSECRGSNRTLCGDGTLLSGDFCTPAATACGPGTVFKNRSCQVPVADPNVGAFVARGTLAEGGDGKVYSIGGTGLSHRLRHVWTELPAADARAWGAGESPMIGTGLALHLALDPIERADDADFSVTLSNLTLPDGSCAADTRPVTKGGVKQLALYQWTAGTATPVACAKAGSVTVSYSRTGYSAEINAVLGDGTVVRKTFYQPISN